MTSDVRVSLAPGASISFTYEVVWKSSDVEFDKRFEKYLDPTFFQHRVGYFISVQFFFHTLGSGFLDTLVLHFQFVHDGNLSGWIGLDDTHANTEKRLCSLSER